MKNDLIKKIILKPFDKDKFKLVQEYKYKDINIPAGFKTNGANIPRIFWSIFPPNSPEYLSAVVVHDFLCEKEEYKKADLYFKEMLLSLKVSKWKIFVLYGAVRLYHKIRYRQ